ncbi:MAG: DEAD/DEAH box helicase [Bacteroidota bacterium]
MSDTINNNQNILDKLGIEALNPMQVEAFKKITINTEVVLLSPTGTGKTVAFLLPIIAKLDADCAEVQALIIVPSRELALQIEQVVRKMGSGFKTNALYGGRAGSEDKIDLKHKPAILIGTPGRIADHLRRESFSTNDIKTLVLDEFDKSLEVGFENEMRDIVYALPKVRKKILTSATNKKEIPSFLALKKPVYIDYLHEENEKLEIKIIASNANNKLDSLVETLSHIGNEPGIVFCNFKDSIEDVSNFLASKNISHGCFYGGLEQKDRELALVKFRNGTYQVLIATDLAARGIDVPEVKFIIHFQLPKREEEFTHRNGRTARMKSDGTAYILKWRNEPMPDFVMNYEIEKLKPAPIPAPSKWKTLYITGGRRDKISKGDVAGLFLKQGELQSYELGNIEIQQDCAFVAVQANKAIPTIQKVNNSKLKSKKVRVSLI